MSNELNHEQFNEEEWTQEEEQAYREVSKARMEKEKKDYETVIEWLKSADAASLVQAIAEANGRDYEELDLLGMNFETEVHNFIAKLNGTVIEG